LTQQLDPHARTLKWDGCVNVRDLGGIPIEDGGVTTARAVVRADTARALSPAGWAALVDYGVQRIVDLRFHSELAADPPQDLPVEVVHVPVLPEVDSGEFQDIDRVAERAGDATEAIRYVYLEFLERFDQRFARAIEAVAFAPEGAVLVHCMGGKDRTGLVSALLLRLAGVAIDDIAQDYAVSSANLRVLNEQWIEEAPNDFERERRVRMSATPAQAMVDVMETIENRYGSALGYLRKAGTGPTAIERARARLRSPAMT
jgi:protein-tyrosine phosphatase